MSLDSPMMWQIWCSVFYMLIDKRNHRVMRSYYDLFCSKYEYGLNHSFIWRNSGRSRSLHRRNRWCARHDVDRHAFDGRLFRVWSAGGLEKITNLKSKVIILLHERYSILKADKFAQCQRDIAIKSKRTCCTCLLFKALCSQEMGEECVRKPLSWQDR